MKRLLAVGCLFSIAVCLSFAEDAKFSSAVSPDDYAAAGLNTLTPAQLQRLDQLVENYKSGALAAAQRAAAEAEAQKQAAEAQAAKAAAEAKAELAAAKAETEIAQRAKADAEKQAAKAEAGRQEATKRASLLAKAKDMFKSDPKKNEPLVETTIQGKFQGWNPHQIFTLANGQRWQVANNESYYTRVRENVKVQILPAAMFGYWMRFPDLDAQVRVNFVSE